LPVAGAPLSTLYPSDLPLTLDGPPRGSLRIDIGGGEFLSMILGCGFPFAGSSTPPGSLTCSLSGYVSVGNAFPYRAATSSEWQQVIDIGLYALNGVNQLLD